MCILAYYVECHLRQKLVRLLFEDYAPSKPSNSLLRKASREHTDGSFLISSFHNLLDNLATYAIIEVALDSNPAHRFGLCGEPTQLQNYSFEC